MDLVWGQLTSSRGRCLHLHLLAPERHWHRHTLDLLELFADSSSPPTKDNERAQTLEDSDGLKLSGLAPSRVTYLELLKLLHESLLLILFFLQLLLGPLQLHLQCGFSACQSVALPS